MSKMPNLGLHTSSYYPKWQYHPQIKIVTLKKYTIKASILKHYSFKLRTLFYSARCLSSKAAFRIPEIQTHGKFCDHCWPTYVTLTH